MCLRFGFVGFLLFSGQWALIRWTYVVLGFVYCGLSVFLFHCCISSRSLVF